MGNRNKIKDPSARRRGTLQQTPAGLEEEYLAIVQQLEQLKIPTQPPYARQAALDKQNQLDEGRQMVMKQLSEVSPSKAKEYAHAERVYWQARTKLYGEKDVVAVPRQAGPPPKVSTAAEIAAARPAAPPPPVADMSIDELVAEATMLYRRKGQGTQKGTANDEGLARAIAVGNMLKTKAEAEITEIEARPATGVRKTSEEWSARVAELKEILTGKRQMATDYAWSDEGLEGTVQQSTSRVAEIGREEVTAAGEATRAKGFDAFIEQVAASDPAIRQILRTAKGRGGAAMGAGAKSARDDLAALTKVFDDAMAGKPISTEGMPGWIPDFFATTAGKAVFEQAKSVGVEPPAVPPTGVAAVPADADAPTAPAVAGAPAGAPAAATTTTTGGRKIDPGLTPTSDKDAWWEAPYRTNLEEAYRQAAQLYYQQDFEGYGESGTDPRDVKQPMIDAFKAMVEEAFSSSNFLTTPSDEQKMAFLEVHFLDQEQGDPPEGVQHDYENIEQTKATIRRLQPFTDLSATIRDNLDSVSDKEGLTKRFSRQNPPNEAALRFELSKVFKIGMSSGDSRKVWLTEYANKMWEDISKFEPMFADPEGYDATNEDLWDVVIGYVRQEASRPPEEIEADFDASKRKAKGMYNLATFRSKLVEGLIAAGKYDSLPSGKELNDWLDSEALRIHTAAQLVYDVKDDNEERDFSGTDEKMATLIEAVVSKPLNDLMDEMEATPDTVIEDWLDEHPSNADLKINEKARLKGGAQSFYDAWVNDVETDLNFQDWMNAKGAGVREDIATEQKEIAEGRNEKAGVKQWFLGKAITAGKYTRTASKELRQAMDAKFEEYWAQVQDLLIPVEGEDELSDSQAQNTALKNFMPDIPDSSEWQRELDEKKAQDERDRVGALKPPPSIEQGFGQATGRLEERVGGATTYADMLEARKNHGRLEQDILDFQGNKFDYYVDGVGITQADFDELHRPALDTMVKEDGSPDDAKRKEYLSSLGIKTYDEQLGQMNQNLKNLKSDEGKFQSQLDQTEYDKEVNTLMMDSPELSRVFASGSVEGLKAFAENLKLPDYLVTHLLQKQQTGGHVLTESEKRFRIAAGLPLPADYLVSQRESSAKRDAALMRQQMRTTQFEATGEERAYTTPDWEKLGYDPMAMSRTGPLTATSTGIAGRGGETVNIPGTNFADTPENREVLREQTAQGYQYKVYAPKDKEEDGEEITPRSPHEVDMDEEEAKEQPLFRIGQIGGGLGA